MTRLLDGSLKDAGDRGAAITEILKSAHIQVDEALLKLLKAAFDNSG